MEKSKHEQKILSSIGKAVDIVPDAAKIVYGSLIDMAEEAVEFTRWQMWASEMTSVTMSMPSKIFWGENFFASAVMRAIFPGTYPDLERAFHTFAYHFHRTSCLFAKYARPESNRMVEFPFYKAYGFNKNYDADLAEYKKWMQDCQRGFVETIKAHNWLADEIRRHINPVFMLEAGRVSVSFGSPFIGDRYSIIPEFTNEERQALPGQLDWGSA